MKAFDCDSMKTLVVTSAVLFAGGMLLQLPALLSFFGSRFVEVILAFIGLLGMFTSLSLVLVVALVSLFPKASRRLKLCEH